MAMFPPLSRRTFLAGGTTMTLAGCVSTPIRDAATVGAAPLKTTPSRGPSDAARRAPPAQQQQSGQLMFYINRSI
jgi:hypothetical protein